MEEFVLQVIAMSNRIRQTAEFLMLENGEARFSKG
jgi:hypothetical protein